MSTLIDNANTAAELIDNYRKVIERTATSIDIPQGTTSIGRYAFSFCTSLASVTIENGVTSISDDAFYSCYSLEKVEIGDSVTIIGNNAFSFCTSLTELTLPNSVMFIGGQVFNRCTLLASVTIGNGFNANGLDLSPSKRYTEQTIVSWLNALADRTGQQAYTLTIGSTNLAKLTAEQIAIATNKNWNLA